MWQDWSRRTAQSIGQYYTAVDGFLGGVNDLQDYLNCINNALDNFYFQLSYDTYRLTHSYVATDEQIAADFTTASADCQALAGKWFTSVADGSISTGDAAQINSLISTAESDLAKLKGDLQSVESAMNWVYTSQQSSQPPNGTKTAEAMLRSLFPVLRYSIESPSQGASYDEEHSALPKLINVLDAQRLGVVNSAPRATVSLNTHAPLTNGRPDGHGHEVGRRWGCGEV